MNSSSDSGSAAPHDEILRQFSGRLQSILTEANNNNRGVALMMVHSAAIDRVDAQLGYPAGNALSARISAILRTRVLRQRDEIEAMSRDEFVCILPGVASEGVALLAAQRAMDALGATPLEQGGAEFADAAIGIVLFPEHGSDAIGLLQHAKRALLNARLENERISIYQPGPPETSPDHSQYVARLVSALDENALELHYMPQLEVRSRRLAGAEALLRWNDPVLGPVPPHVVVQTAESSGLMDRLTQWIITSAIQQCARFRTIAPDFKVSVNISPSNLREPDLPLFIDRALRTWQVPSSNLIIEITETAMIDNQAAANEALHELKAFGISLSMDDFGTGYSSMYYLARMPLDELKIDQTFVCDMLEVPNNAKIVRSLIDLSHNLELSVVAEGVENEATLEALADLGCDQAQGYHIGQALRAEALLARISQQQDASLAAGGAGHD